MKKRRYVYYRCTGNRGRCEERDHCVREEVLAERFGAVLQEMAIEPRILEWVAQALRSGHEDEKRFRDEAVARLERDQRTLQDRLDSAYVDKVDGRINNAYFERMAAKWREGGDSNPRRDLTSLTRLAGGRFQPLSHLPAETASICSVGRHNCRREDSNACAG